MRQQQNANATGKPAAPAESQKITEETGMGEIQIHENVVASLVLRAVLSVDGVTRLAGSSLVDNIAEIVGSRRMQERSISIDLQPEGRVAIQVKVNMRFGAKIPEVAPVIQKKVIEVVEEATGMTVTKVNVLVQEFEEDPEREPEDEGGNTAMPIPPTVIG